jgi:hypothetical protein
MRNISLAVAMLVASVTGAQQAHASPFDPATIPDAVGVVGHLDVDALRRTQVFDAAGGQAAIDAALDGAPSKMRSIARTLSRSIRGVSFWHDNEEGAVYVATRDSRSLGRLIAQLPSIPTSPIDGFPTYKLEDDGESHGFCAVYADTLVLAHDLGGLERAIRVLAGKAPSLVGSRKLPAAARQGVFMFVTIGDDALGAIKKSARARVLQLGLRSLVLDAGEAGGFVTATARAEMDSPEAVQKAKTILDGARTMASLSDEPSARSLLDGVSVTSTGTTLVVSAKLPVAEAARWIRDAK